MNPLMLATDGSPSAAAATGTAIELAAALDAPIVIVSCWEIAYPGLGIGASIVPDVDRVEQQQAEEVV